MYKAVIFDLDNTLYEYEDINKDAIAALRTYTCSRYGISGAEFHEIFERARKDTKDILGNTGASHNRMLYFQKILEYIGRPPVEGTLEMYEAYWGYILDHMEPYEGVAELFQYCRTRGLKIGICSDLTAAIQHRKLRKLGLAPWIDAVVTSEEAGAEKPAQIMFTMMLDKLGISPREAFFIGDSMQKDVRGATQVGIRAVRFPCGSGSGADPALFFRRVRDMLERENT